ncbi:HEAT repeat domain-containing protein, partial [Zavarzinella formosa]|uniref:HEAT repeat domain-containing protein n=1 Tax=Zavarzinella formosa TaxID=360055 RepID=UPI00187D898D
MNTVPQTTPVPAPRSRGKWLGRAGLLALLLVAAGVWQRERVYVWYCAERLERASAEHKNEWAEKLAGCGPTAGPTLVSLLRSDDQATCQAAREGFDVLWKSIPDGDAARTQLTAGFFETEPRFSTPGRAAGLDLLPALTAGKTDGVIEKAKGMINTAIRSESVDVRILAIAACMRPTLDAVELALPLMNDSSADVRRAAILALGPARDREPIITDDELLNWLHDRDGEVRRLCEMSLRSRGRSQRDIHLGRLYTSPEPSVRQKLLIELAEEEELDVTVWLERLTNDNDPAVRAGAVRVAADRRAALL